MELLIPGLILVALMVYASTKIKKNAAQAYEEEVIEHENFRLIKPEGFINPIDPAGDALLTAYTRDFGIEESAEKRLVTANVLCYNDKTLAEKQSELANGDVQVSEQRSFQMGSFPAALLVTSYTDNEARMMSFHKLIEDEGKLYELKTDLLEDTKEKFLERVEKMTDSFELR